MPGFRWNDWNLEQTTKHGCRLEEIESVIRHEVRARRARKVGNDKWRVEGRGIGDRMMEAIFIWDDGDGDTVYVIHAMPLTTRRRRN
ncbi:MAG TPA: hypothetical protein VFC46_07390 [Humisphaera sp.]|nr:hypothetical protein [Humisphaera sp.]